MSTKTKLIIISALILVSFAVGRYSVEFTKTKQETQVVNEKDKKDTETHTVTKTIVVQEPNGETRTETTQDTRESSKQQDIDSSTTQLSETSTPTNKSSTLTVSALAAVKGNNLSGAPIYGASISKSLIGPINIGVFGLTDSTMGVSLGISF